MKGDRESKKVDDDFMSVMREAGQREGSKSGGLAAAFRGNVSTSNINRLARYQFIYSLCGLVFGLVCVIAGMILFFNGIAGSTSWIAKFVGLESTVSNAAPGVVLFIVGLLVIFVTRFNVTVEKDK